MSFELKKLYLIHVLLKNSIFFRDSYNILNISRNIL